MFTELLLCISLCSKYLTCSKSCNPHTNSSSRYYYYAFHLLCISLCSKCFTRINSCNPHTNPCGRYYYYSFSYIRGNRYAGSLNNLSLISQLCWNLDSLIPGAKLLTTLPLVHRWYFKYLEAADSIHYFFLFILTPESFNIYCSDY